MKVGVIGGGLTGLTAAYELLKKGYKATVWESQPFWGGLAAAYEILPKVFLERYYHHIFTSDTTIISLCKELGIGDRIASYPSKTSVFYNGRVYPFGSIKDFLTFSPLGLIDRLRFGVVSLFLKLIQPPLFFETETAVTWLKKGYGQHAYEVVWEPLLKGKFSRYFDEVVMTWFWARVKKRTFNLIYPQGGFQTIVDALTRKIRQLGGELRLGAELRKMEMQTDGRWRAEDGRGGPSYDRLISTTSLKTFVKMFPSLPGDYIKNVESIAYLNAHMLILVLKNHLTSAYWLNINDARFPFLALVEQDNLVGLGACGGKHLVYLGNYLPDGDLRLTLGEKQLLDLYEPYLKEINNSFDREWVEKAVVFSAPFAQPVVARGYKDKIPPFRAPLPNLYLASMAQVYPWDRGTNYAVKLAQDLVREHF